MHTDGETVAVDLVAMQQPWLYDALAAADLIEQPVHIGDEVAGDVGEMCSDHRAQQQAPEARRRIDRQHQVSQRDATRRRDRTRVPDLQLGQQHGVGPLHVRSQQVVQLGSDRLSLDHVGLVTVDERRSELVGQLAHA